ncbi:MAG: D-glycerate dehydrogenase [Rubrivivax sp.]|nr:D-glycerate dehydrogenase [Rubrivivax sp.]MBK8528650.1 D-glycerate dehydrogenase [Rubrivivax sp.]
MDKPRVLVARAIFPQVLDRLREHFEVEANPDDRIYDHAELIRRLQGKQGALTTGSERIDAEVLDANPQLRAVCNMAVGYNNFDLPACTARGVLATNTPDVLTETTADFGFALMMAAARRICESEHFLRRGEWTRWSYDMFVGADVHGATLGILGMGRIGQAIARRGALGFGMRVIYHNRSRLPAEQESPIGARWVDKAALLREADHLVLVLPYGAQSHHAIGAAELAQMKRSATLTNLARGGIVDDVALATALRDRRIAAAGLDVFENEPRVHPDLLALSNVVLTPHIASASVATRLAMANLAADNLIAALGCGPDAGRPPSLLNPQPRGAD